MQQPSTASEEDSPQPPTIEVTALPRRLLVGVFGLVLLTSGSLGLAWYYPDMTLLHFLWVAQTVPVLYLLLAWWGMQTSQSDAT